MGQGTGGQILEPRSNSRAEFGVVQASSEIAQTMMKEVQSAEQLQLTGSVSATFGDRETSC